MDGVHGYRRPGDRTNAGGEVRAGGSVGQEPRRLDPSASGRAFFGAELRAWRQRRGLSQEALGRLAYVSGALIGKLEKAQRRPLADLVSILDRVLEADGELLESFAAAQVWEQSRSSEAEPWPSPVDELAELVGPVVRLGANTLLPIIDSWVHWARLQPLPACLGSPPIADQTIAAIVGRVRELRLLDDGGGSWVLEWALHDLRWARRVLREFEESGGFTPRLGALHRVVGELAQLAGWIACDGGRHGRAQKLWLMGLGSAQAAGDVRLGATIMSCLSYQALWLGEAKAALELAAAARRAAAGLPGGAFHALLATREARARAATGDALGCERTLEQASMWVATSRPGEEPEWVYWVTPAVLAADAGRASFELGDHRRAVDRLTRGLELFGQSQQRNQALHLTSLAAAHLSADDAEAAAAAVDTVLAILPVYDSHRVRQRLSGLLSLLTRAGAPGRLAADRIHAALVA